MDELERRVHIRNFERNIKEGPDQTFEEWMNSLEQTINEGFHSVETQSKFHFEDHTRFLNRLESLFIDFPNIIEGFHGAAYDYFMREVRDMNDFLTPSSKKIGRASIPASIAQFLLWGMEISKRETNGFELFRIYYRHALENDFNMTARLMYFTKKIMPEWPTPDEDAGQISSGYHHYFPTVPPKEQIDTSWARSLKQNLKKIIENEKR